MESPIILQTNRLKLYYGAFEALKGIDCLLYTSCTNVRLRARNERQFDGSAGLSFL